MRSPPKYQESLKKPTATPRDSATCGEATASSPSLSNGANRTPLNESIRKLAYNINNDLDSLNNLKSCNVKAVSSNTNRFTNEIERELANLTLSIEKEMEQQQQQQQDHYYRNCDLDELNLSSMGRNSTLNNSSLSHKNYGKCYKCSKEIFDRNDACLAIGNLYHLTCFTCVSCGRTLRGKPFYNINNQYYCEEDYSFSGYLQNTEKCTICNQSIVDQILQACGKSYHPGCFRCSVCNISLDGLPFTLDINNRIFCIQDYYK